MRLMILSLYTNNIFRPQEIKKGFEAITMSTLMMEP